MSNQTNTDKNEWEDGIKHARIRAFDDVFDAVHKTGAVLTPSGKMAILEAVAAVCDIEHWDYKNKLRQEVDRAADDVFRHRTNTEIAFLKIAFKTELLPGEQERFLCDTEREWINHLRGTGMSIRDIAYILDRSVSTIHQAITDANRPNEHHKTSAPESYSIGAE